MKFLIGIYHRAVCLRQLSCLFADCDCAASDHTRQRDRHHLCLQEPTMYQQKLMQYVDYNMIRMYQCFM